MVEEPQVVRRAMVLALIAASIAACGPGSDPSVPGAAETDGAVEVEGSPSPAPGEIGGASTGLSPEALSIEGMPASLPMEEIASPPAFPLGFSTVAPGDMLVDYLSSGEGDAVRFEAAFAGVHSPDASLAMVVLPAGTTADEAREWVREIAGGTPRPADVRAPWMAESYTIRGDHSGFAALGEREQRWFYFLASYPPEFGDGMGPRIDVILSRWRWSDGSGLSTPAQ